GDRPEGTHLGAAGPRGDYPRLRRSCRRWHRIRTQAVLPAVRHPGCTRGHACVRRQAPARLSGSVTSMPDTSQVLSDLHDGVQTITLNQPERFNALSSAMLTGLGEALRVAERDAAVRAVVLTGAGKAFSSGADITEINVSNGVMDAGDYLRRGYNPLITRMRALEKPLLAAVNGVAAGAGLSMALACDLRYAAESAR